MRHILIVEDNDMNRNMLRRRLARLGFRISEAVSGTEALWAVASDRPDVIVMDLNLPDKDGWTATRELKAADTTRGIPVIALTAHALAEDRQKALDAGCDDYLPKPVDLSQLLSRIAALTMTGDARV